MSFHDFMEWESSVNLGDLAGFVGLLITVSGFGFTFWGVLSSRNAAQRAEAAAKSAVNRIRVVDELVEFSTALGAVDEIRRLHRTPNWPLLLDRYAALRRSLIALRAAKITLTPAQLTSVQSALVALKSIEASAEKALASNSLDLDVAKFNNSLARKAEGLQTTLVELKLTLADTDHGKV